MLKRFYSLALLQALCQHSAAFEILAIGSSNTNCKNVDRSQIFTAHLESMLKTDGINATVINGGKDGDEPIWMIRRLTDSIKADTKIVILEPGPNDKSKSRSIEYSEKMLTMLKEKQIPTIYVSNNNVQSAEEAKEFVKGFGAYYYGNFASNMPVTQEYRQYDGGHGGGAGHLTAKGCEQWAKSIMPLVKKVIADRKVN